MAFTDNYKLSCHAVITNNQRQVLLVKATYADISWGLPGGSVDKGETVHQALLREAVEELGKEINILYLSGVYYHSVYNSHVFIFRAEFKNNSDIVLSAEHSEYKFVSIDELSKVQQVRVLDCINFLKEVVSRAF